MIEHVLGAHYPVHGCFIAVWKDNNLMSSLDSVQAQNLETSGGMDYHFNHIWLVAT